MIVALITALLSPTPQVAKLPDLKPWQPPYEVVAQPTNYASYESQLGPSRSGVYIKDDVMSFLAKGKENPMMLPDWLRLAFIHDASDLWVTQVRMKNSDQSFFTYTTKDGEHYQRPVFRAPKAPRAPKSVAKLAGTMQTIHFASRELGEIRDLKIYLPPNANGSLNAVYMADGQYCEDYAKLLEPLILAKKVAPTAIIGLFHGGYKGDIQHYDMAQDFRAREYLKVADPERFAHHLRFMIDEVMPWAERKFGLEPSRDHRALFGYSNGGAFALVASAERPEVFGSVLPLSIAVFDRDALKQTVTGKKLPRYYIAAGTLESFQTLAASAADILKSVHAPVRFDSYITGHDEAMWQLVFARTVPKIFPYRTP